MKQIEDLRLSRNMKYEALYWALGYISLDGSVFTKNYNGLLVTIDLENQYVNFNGKLSIVNSDKFKLDTHKSFVILECIDKLLTMGYKTNEIIIDFDNEYDIYLKDLYIKCYEWNHMKEDTVIFKKNTFISISYMSRLVSGIIERKTFIKDSNNKLYECGIFENEYRKDVYTLHNPEIVASSDFIIKETIAVKYIGNKQKVIVPEGVTELSSCLFWDNQTIDEVVLPESLISLGGDTFYNSKNLKKVNIPLNTRFMGNNPFAGCPKLEIVLESNHFTLIDNVLFNKDASKLIYYPIKKKTQKYDVPPTTKIIGKHSFYLCDNLEHVTIPQSVIKLENNPFSGCSRLHIDNKSKYYHIENDIIYDQNYKSVVGALKSINSEELVLKNVERISRNSFWNCKGIKKIVLPSTLIEIGYNPFVGCSNISFISHSENFMVENGILFNQDKSKIICYPANLAVGNVFIPDSVIELERSAFSGCDKMTSIHLHNVSIITKTCFTNCNLLEEVYCSDLVTYVGEWAFAHCNNMKRLSVYKDCFVDANATLNSNVQLIMREYRSNYVIESDNLPTLKSMLNAYKGRIKSIITDPPYNSNIHYIGYKDSNFSNGYFQFLKERFEVAKDLLTNNGFLVINIYAGEVKGLTKLCKSLYNKVMVCKWEKLHLFFDKNREIQPNKKDIRYEYIIICSKSSEFDFKKIMQPYIENSTLKEKESDFPKIFTCFGTNSSAKDEMKDLFGDRNFFRTPKPLKLIKELVRATTDKNSIVLDCFAGSGTTGHAVIDLNNEDGGTRKYILISNNESDICKNVTLKRIQLFDKNVVFID